MGDAAAAIDVRIHQGDPWSGPGLDDLAAAINEEHSDLEAEFIGAAFSWEGGMPAVEIVAIYVGTRAVLRGVDVATNNIVDRIVKTAITWARSALRHEAESESSRSRPKRVVIYGPDHKVVRSVLVNDPDSEPEFDTP